MSGPLTKKEWEVSVAEAFSMAVESTYRDMIEAAILKEREACAKLCDRQAREPIEGEWTSCASHLANKIRARKKP